LISRLTVPFKGLVQRFAFLSLVLAAFGLMLLGKADTLMEQRLRTVASDVIAPVLGVLSRPVDFIDGVLGNLRELAALRSENQRLRQEVERLNAWHSVARQLEAENNSLRELLSLNANPRHGFISARVIADGGGPFVRSVLLNAGTGDGVAKGQPAVNGDGLVGRVMDAGRRSARLLLVTDLNSRIPVVIEETRLHAILAGDNSNQPQLVFLPDKGKVPVGARVVTSGYGNALPPGLPIGVVALVQGRTARIRTFVKWNRLEYVRLIDFRGKAEPSDGGGAGQAAP
jgi:rod shape-determining protein MreC